LKARLKSYDSPVFFGPRLSGCIHEEGKNGSVRWLFMLKNCPGRDVAPRSRVTPEESMAPPAGPP